MSSSEFSIGFTHQEINYNIHLVKEGKSSHFVEVNGLNYAVLGKEDQLDTACKILNSISLESISAPEDIYGRLSKRADISFPAAKKTDIIGIQMLDTQVVPSLQTNEDLAKILDEIVPSWPIPGGSPTVTITDQMKFLGVQGARVSVFHQDSTEESGWNILSKGYGELSDPGQKIQAASISKTITALTIMSLIDEKIEIKGKLLSLETDVRDILDEKLWGSISEFDIPVTLSQLMSHTAGIPEDGQRGFIGYEPNQKLPENVDDILTGKGTTSDPVKISNKPGTQYAYAGGGAMILQKMIEIVTVKPFDAVVKERIFEKLEMNDSSFSPDSTCISGHKANGEKVQMLQPELAAAGLWTTPEDLAKVAIGIQKSLMSKGGIISQNLAEKMIAEPDKKVFLPNIHEIPGLGVFTLRSGDTTYFMHDGSNVGYRCIFIGTNKGDGAVIMTNSEFGNDLIPEVIRKIAKVYDWEGRDILNKKFPAVNQEVQEANQRREPADPVQWLNDNEGIYQVVAGVNGEIFSKNEKIYFQTPNPKEPPYEITPLSKHVGIFWEDGRIQSIEFKENENQTIMVINNELTFVKV